MVLNAQRHSDYVDCIIALCKVHVTLSEFASSLPLASCTSYNYVVDTGTYSVHIISSSGSGIGQRKARSAAGSMVSGRYPSSQSREFDNWPNFQHLPTILPISYSY